MNLYLASPLGFSEVGRTYCDEHLIPLLSAAGHDVIDPFKLTSFELINSVQNLSYGPDKKEAWRKVNSIIGENNLRAIDRCDALIAVLDGVDVDSGTAAEVGYAFALKKLIVGYRGDFRLSSDNEGGVVNLQVEYFIRQSGGDIVGKTSKIVAAISAGDAARRVK